MRPEFWEIFAKRPFFLLLFLKGLVSVIRQEEPRRSRLYASGPSGRAPKLPVFARLAFFVCFIPSTFRCKKLAELIFRYWRRVWGENQENIARKQWRPHFTLPLVVVRHSVINTWHQHVPRLRVIDTHLCQIARVGWGSTLRRNHFLLPPGRNGQFLNVHNFAKNKDFS